jgi:hypothetical protein
MKNPVFAAAAVNLNNDRVTMATELTIEVMSRAVAGLWQENRRPL